MVLAGRLESAKGTARDVRPIQQFARTINRILPKSKKDHNTIHLASVDDSAEDEDTVKYLQSCALQAGLDARYIFMKDLESTASVNL